MNFSPTSARPTAIEIRLPIASNEDVVVVRQKARELSQRMGFSLTETTKIVTAASELGRNAMEHGGGGWVDMEVVSNENRSGIRMTFADEGPGIPDVQQALKDGYSTGKGLGLGLGGSRRLMHDFKIDSAPGQGTRVIVTRWR